MQVIKLFKDLEKKAKGTKKREDKRSDSSHLTDEGGKEHGRKVKVTETNGQPK